MNPQQWNGCWLRMRESNHTAKYFLVSEVAQSLFFASGKSPLERMGAIDSAIAPPQNQQFSSTNVPWLPDTRKDTIESKVSIYSLVRKGLSIDDVGVSGNPAFKEIRPGAGVETGDFVKEKFRGGYRTTTWVYHNIIIITSSQHHHNIITTSS